MLAWKLFEEKNGQPRSLVHGLPIGNIRTRLYPLGIQLEREVNTPGFNIFTAKEDALKYWPRFKVRAPKLVLCEIEANDVLCTSNSAYALAQYMIIPTQNWPQRIRGISIFP